MMQGVALEGEKKIKSLILILIFGYFNICNCSMKIDGFRYCFSFHSLIAKYSFFVVVVDNFLLIERGLNGNHLFKLF